MREFSMSKTIYNRYAAAFLVLVALVGATVWAAANVWAEGAAKSKDCCELKQACCDATRACCQASKKPGCCDQGMACCKDNDACCAKAPDCCQGGKDCCKAPKGCCNAKSVGQSASADCCSAEAKAACLSSGASL
jgi:hypothetical protein